MVMLAVLPQAASAQIAGGSVVKEGDALLIAMPSAVEGRFLTVSDPRVHIARDEEDDHLIRLTPAPARAVEVRALSRDGHATVMTVDASGILSSTGRDPGAAVVGRGLLLAALCLLLGMAVVRRVVVERGLSDPIRPPGTRPESAPIHRGDLDLPGAAWTLIGALGVLGGVAVVATTLRRLETGGTSALSFLLDTRMGIVLVVQMVAVLISCALLRRRSAGSAAVAAWVAGLTGLALLASSLGGHATAGSDAVLGFVFDGVHTLASAVWLGGLVALAVAIGRGTSGDGPRLPALAAVVVRFSALALICVAAIVVTGVYRALAELPSVSSLTDTGYGVALLVKLAVFALMLVVAAYNRFVIHPRLERAALGLAEDDRGAAVLLRRSVRVEITLAVVVLAVVAVLVATTPPM